MGNWACSLLKGKPSFVEQEAHPTVQRSLDQLTFTKLIYTGFTNYEIKLFANSHFSVVTIVLSFIVLVLCRSPMQS